MFFDDILVFSPTLEQHEQDLCKTLQLLREHQWQLKLSKCTFAQQSLHYLGHVISGTGVATDPSKISDVKNWETPANIKELRGFLCLAGYYRKFVKGYGIISRPLTDLLKKNTVYVWTSETEASFQALKSALIEASVLALPNFTKTFVVETDASDKGIGVVLQQDGHPVAYMSHALGPRSQGLSTYEKECMDVLMAVEHWRSYL